MLSSLPDFGWFAQATNKTGELQNTLQSDFVDQDSNENNRPDYGAAQRRLGEVGVAQDQPVVDGPGGHVAVAEGVDADRLARRRPRQGDPLDGLREAHRGVQPCCQPRDPCARQMLSDSRYQRIVFDDQNCFAPRTSTGG